MRHYRKGRVTAVYHHSGCCEVVVQGESSGSFSIDNLCMWSIVDAEGADWIGRQVEYQEGFMRFLDTQPAPLSPEPTLVSCPPALP